jgi:hypothetical protein
MQPGRDGGVLHHAAGEGVGCGVEKPPRAPALLKVVEGGLIVLLRHIGDALDADGALTPHSHDGVIGHLVGEDRVLVAVEGSLLPLALVGQGLDDLADDAGEIALQVRGVLALDDRIGQEGEVVADEDARAETDPDREAQGPADEAVDRVSRR